VGILAQAAALKLKLRYLELPVGDDLVQRLRDAESRNEPLVILTDVWTVGIDRHGNLMRRYDEADLANCAVLVPWNGNEPDRNRRYRAVKSVWPSPRVCHFCETTQPELGEVLQVHHLDEAESHLDSHNLIHNCRSCHQLTDRVLKAAGCGIKTRQ
jgi:hypothetical protein